MWQYESVDGGVAVFNAPAKLSLSDLARLATEPLRAAGAKRAIVFGSYARGCADAWSDLDLAVILETDLPRWERGRTFDGLYDAVPVAIDLLVFTPSEFERGIASGLDVFASILSDGKTIYPQFDEQP